MNYRSYLITSKWLFDDYFLGNEKLLRDTKKPTHLVLLRLLSKQSRTMNL